MIYPLWFTFTHISASHLKKNHRKRNKLKSYWYNAIALANFRYELWIANMSVCVPAALIVVYQNDFHISSACHSLYIQTIDYFLSGIYNSRKKIKQNHKNRHLLATQNRGFFLQKTTITTTIQLSLWEYSRKNMSTQ